MRVDSSRKYILNKASKRHSENMTSSAKSKLNRKMNYESTNRQILLKSKDIRLKGSRKGQNYIHNDEEESQSK